MKRILACLGIFLLFGLTATDAPAMEKKEAKGDSTTAAEPEQHTMPEPARESGYFARGGRDIGRGYAYAGRQFGRGAADFGKNFPRGHFAEAGRCFGRGAAEFGKGIGIGTGRAFKNFGLAFRNLGQHLDRAASETQKNSEERN